MQPQANAHITKEGRIPLSLKGDSPLRQNLWKRVIDLSTLDLSSIQLKRAPDGQKRPYFVLQFATTDRYKNIELFQDGGRAAGDAELQPDPSFRR